MLSAGQCAVETGRSRLSGLDDRGSPRGPARSGRYGVGHELEQVAAFGWRAQETVRLGEWLLRASGGFTQRANSVLAVGDPGVALESRSIGRRSGTPSGAQALVMESDGVPGRARRAPHERGWTRDGNVRDER